MNAEEIADLMKWGFKQVPRWGGKKWAPFRVVSSRSEANGLVNQYKSTFGNARVVKRDLQTPLGIATRYAVYVRLPDDEKDTMSQPGKYFT